MLSVLQHDKDASILVYNFAESAPDQTIQKKYKHVLLMSMCPRIQAIKTESEFDYLKQYFS